MPVPFRSRRIVVPVLVLLAIVAALVGTTARMGYWGGPVFTWVPATAPPPPASRKVVGVYFSGDVGFGWGMGRRVAGRLAGHGIPVLGVNSLTAFATRRSPAETAALVRDATTTALARSGAAKVVLMGQSFGANALLGGIDALPPALRARVQDIVFVVPADTQLLHASPAGYLDFGRSDGAALPLARALTWAPVMCIHGETEVDSLCPLWRQPNVAAITLPGDHFLRHDDGAVARVVLTMIARSAGRR